jgi:MFS family permease
MHARAPAHLWRSVRGMPDFWRLLQVRMASQFGEGLFQAGLAGALLFNPDRAADPMAIARAFTVLFLPYSLLGPFAGALMDRWDRRLVLVGANAGRLVLVAGIGAILAVGAGEVPLLIAALLTNGLSRFVMSGLSAALPDVVPREEVVTMNSVSTASGAVAAFLGANFMLVPRWIVGPGDRGASAIVFLVAVPVLIALLLSWRFVLVHHLKDPAIGGLGTALLFFGASGLGSFLATVFTPSSVRRWGRYATANGALVASAIIQVAAAGLVLPIMVTCSFFLGVSGQVIKLCADSAIQIDVEDALRGHVFAVQDALFWVAFIVSITVAAILIPDDGHAPLFVVFGSLLYLIGLLVHSTVARRQPARQ